MDTTIVIPFETIALLRRLAENLHKQGDTSQAFTLAVAIADVVQTTSTPAFYAATFLGGCPCCGDCEEVFTLDSKRYSVCHEHRRYWYIGRDYLALHNDTPEHLGQQRSILAAYREVPAMEVFAKPTCPCCGLAIEHAAWCVETGATRP
jgi:hypothetical protein